MDYKIKSPNENYNGESAGVNFINGEGISKDGKNIDWFRKKGYSVIPIEPKEPEAPKEPKEPKKPKAQKEPETPKEPKEPKEPEAPKEPKEPKKPEAPKELKEPKESEVGDVDDNSGNSSKEAKS